MDIFVSYSSLDEAFAQQLKRDLEGAGHTVWIDSDEIPGGERFSDRIRSGIQSCEVVVVIETHDWLASDECRGELDLAVDCGKRVVSVQPRRLGRIEVPPGLDGRSPIGFWREAGHGKALDALEKTLVEDHAWLTAYRDLLVDASRWERSDGQDVRLGGEALRAAVRLVERASVGLVKPDLVAVQRAYVRACESSTRSGSGRRR